MYYYKDYNTHMLISVTDCLFQNQKITEITDFVV